MRNAWIIARRELGAIFVQPIAYIFAVVLLLLTGLLFALQLSDFVLSAQFGGGPPPQAGPILRTFTFIMLFVGPAITMRLLSEEQKSGTMELLMTLPVRDGEIVLGKFMAAFIYYSTLVALTLVYPFILLRFGNPDTGPIITSYLGLLLWGAAVLGIGVLASALAENQIVSYMIAFGIILLMYLIGFLAGTITQLPIVNTVIRELSLDGHFIDLSSGLIKATDVLFYLLVTAVALFAATRVLESKRWR